MEQILHAELVNLHGLDLRHQDLVMISRSMHHLFLVHRIVARTGLPRHRVNNKRLPRRIGLEVVLVRRGRFVAVHVNKLGIIDPTPQLRIVRRSTILKKSR